MTKLEVSGKLLKMIEGVFCMSIELVTIIQNEQYKDCKTATVGGKRKYQLTTTNHGDGSSTVDVYEGDEVLIDSHITELNIYGDKCAIEVVEGATAIFTKVQLRDIISIIEKIAPQVEFLYPH